MADKKKMERIAPLTIKDAQSKKKSDRLKRCRYCTNEKDIKRFYLSNDFLDTDGKMTICMDCCSFLFNYFYSIHSRIDVALYEVCRNTNVRYDSKTYSSLIAALEKNSMQATINSINGEYEEDFGESTIDEVAVDTKKSLFGKYLTTLRLCRKDLEPADLIFDVYKNDRPEGYEDKTTDKLVKDVIEDVYAKRLTLLERKWGKNLEEDDYAYLESEYSSWAKAKDTDEKGVDILIKEVCQMQLRIKKVREDGGNPTKVDIELLTSLMDKASVSPDRMKENTSNKSVNAYGAWIKDVEMLSPAEWVENLRLFKDVEGIDQYVKRTYDRAVKNYIGMQRDFRIVASKMEEESDSADFSDIIDASEDLEDGVVDVEER